MGFSTSDSILGKGFLFDSTIDPDFFKKATITKMKENLQIEFQID